jgi:uncharacterized protein (DUF2236 family)
MGLALVGVAGWLWKSASADAADKPAARPRQGTLIVAQRLNAERLVLLGWTRAILLQLAHPLIAAGVYDHSSFRATPLAAAVTLHATIRAMLALSFGTDAEREHALHGIRTIHTRVNGHLPKRSAPFPPARRTRLKIPRSCSGCT